VLPKQSAKANSTAPQIRRGRSALCGESDPKTHRTPKALRAKHEQKTVSFLRQL
jgi:hypothetical protein